MRLAQSRLKTFNHLHFRIILDFNISESCTFRLFSSWGHLDQCPDSVMSSIINGKNQGYVRGTKSNYSCIVGSWQDLKNEIAVPVGCSLSAISKITRQNCSKLSNYGSKPKTITRDECQLNSILIFS